MKPTLSPKYGYAVTGNDNSQLITLTQIETGKVKEFPSVAKSVTGLDYHMAFMTEETCKPFFKGL